MSITAKELAEKLGLSAAAVSLALNNKPGVSTQTRQRVLDAACQYGYDMTRISVKKSAVRDIRFLIYKKHGAVVSDTAFFSELFEGVSEGCKERDYRLTIQYIYDSGDRLEHGSVRNSLEVQLEDLNVSAANGVILLGTELTADRFAAFSHIRVPFVVLDTYFENRTANYVLINNVQGAYLATSYLIARTGAQPGYLRSSYSIGNFEERAHGFYNAVRAGGMSPSRSIVHRLSPSVEGAFADMMELLEAGEETAASYFADNDLIALGAMKAFKAKGYRIPEDVSIAGFDNIAYVNVFEPGLTTVHVPKKELDRTAAFRLAEILERGQDIPMKIEIATKLIKRKSA